MKTWLWILALMIHVGCAWGQTQNFSVSTPTKEYYPEDSVQVYRTTYRFNLNGQGKIKSIVSIRVEDWVLEFEKLDRKIKMKGAPLNVVVNCMENRGAKRTEWLHTAWYGPQDKSTNLYVIHNERLKEGHGDMPDIEVILMAKGGRKKLTATLPD